jgi:hypothetical protein
MHTILWWTVWGLVVGLGLLGLRESLHHPLHLIVAVPLISGALAAAVKRLHHEYHAAILHAKWLLISSLFLTLGGGYVYLKGQAYGPFATASSHRAFMRCTFEMSIPEVERALGRKLQSADPTPFEPAGLTDWLFEIIPLPGRPLEVRLLPDLLIYRVPCTARFEFVQGKLSQVALRFDKTNWEETAALLQHLREDLAKDYQSVQADIQAASHKKAVAAPEVYRKDCVEAALSRETVGAHQSQVNVVLQYLPLAEEKPKPLSIDVQVF